MAFFSFFYRVSTAEPHTWILAAAALSPVGFLAIETTKGR
jgi:hypothetical protein